MLFTKSLDRAPRVHFCGIGGVAMVAGARLALEAGWEVRGSDNPLYPPASKMVEDLDVPVAVGYAASNLDWEPDVVVVGNILSRGNPEAEAVLERHMHYVSLPEWLKETILRQRHPIVVCGTHGKTTTTTLAAYLLDQAGRDPGFFIGGQPLNFPYSARSGAIDGPFVIEGDEYDTAFFDKRAKFFHYLPEIAVVTSLEFDHGDIYPDLAAIELAFQRMLRQIRPSGWLVLCADAPRAMALREHAPCNVITYGFHQDAHWRVTKWQTRDTGMTSMSITHQGQAWGDLDVPMAGRYNLQNILAAIAVADLHGIGHDEISQALQDFKGVKRRMEVFHEARGLTFIDDFAHHPTAIEGAIGAARERWPGRPLVVLFEARSNTTVTNRFQTQMEQAFTGADEIVLGPVHRPERVPPEERLDREALAASLKAAGRQARWTDNVEEIVQDLQGRDDNAVVLILSNGAFGGIYARIREAF